MTRRIAGLGRRSVRRARIGPRDLAVGISASGTTPFVLAALDEARRGGAAAGLLTSNPAARPAGVARVLLDTGPELVAGSTRMKAGSAAKMALSLLSTAAMLQLGRVRGGRMIDLAPNSQKLRGRALRIEMELANASAPGAEAALAASGWRVRAALAALVPGGLGAHPRFLGEGEHMQGSSSRSASRPRPKSKASSKRGSRKRRSRSKPAPRVRRP